MKNKLSYCRLYLKNNIKNFYSIYIILTVIYVAIFWFSTQMFWLVDFENFFRVENIPSLMAIIIFILIMIPNAIVIYNIFYKKNDKKLTVYKMLGARKSDIIFSFFIEFLLIILISVLLGFLLDLVVIFSIFQISFEEYFITDFARNEYLGYSILTVLIIPMITLIIACIKQQHEKMYGCVYAEE